jgi:transposase
MDGMREHLRLISQCTAPGCHAVIVTDGTAFHQKYLADEFENLAIVKLPPYSPKLNPVEQV